MINKCFCTRRNPISISAAAIYLACQLEDKRKTQAEICKVTGLTEVTLRKVYKELLENWDDLLPSNYNPVVPPEKAFPTATISSGRSSSTRADLVEAETKHNTKPSEVVGVSNQVKGKENAETKDNFLRAFSQAMLGTPFWKPGQRPPETNTVLTHNMEIDLQSNSREEKRIDDAMVGSSSLRPVQFPSPPSLAAGVVPWPFRPPMTSGLPPSAQFGQPQKAASIVVDKGHMQQNLNEKFG